MMAGVASADLIIDDFAAPNPMVTGLINAIDPDPTLLQTPAAGVLGGERDLLLDVLGTSVATSYVSAVGEGTFAYNCDASLPGTVATLQYDGVDADPAAALVNSEGLGGVDLTAHGNRLQLDFFSVTSAGGAGTGVQIEVHSGAQSATFAGTIPDNPATSRYVAPFADFAGPNVFASASSISVRLNPAGAADADGMLHEFSVGSRTPLDDFADPTPQAVVVIDAIHPNPTLIETPSFSVLGGERDVLLTVSGTVSPVSFSGTIGDGQFLFGSATGLSATAATIQYDGADTDVWGPPASLVNSERLGNVDLTAMGSGFVLDFQSIDGGNRSDTDIEIEVHSNALSAAFAGVIPDSAVPFTYAVDFASFVGDDVFTAATSITVRLNPNGVPDVDFVLSRIDVPEPVAAALLAIGAVVLLRRRRRAGPQ